MSRFIRTRSKLSTLGIELDKSELIGALMNSLPANEFIHEKNNLLMFPQDTFEGAVDICTRTSSLSKRSSSNLGTSAFYSSAASTTHAIPSAAASMFPSATDITEATACALAKVLDQKLGSIRSPAVGSGHSALRGKQRPKCNYCGKDGHLEAVCYKRERETSRHQHLDLVMLRLSRQDRQSLIRL